jgi:glycosyltransferase involved in cell wall biosynthesis
VSRFADIQRRRRSPEALVSAIVATRDRPRFLALLLEYYRRQTYAWRELIIIDDGQLHPADAAAVERVGGRLLRLPEPTPLGTKLNLGAEAARGRYCAKLDDDDFYAPRYIETLVRTVEARSVRRCEPTLAFMAPFVFFDVGTWRTHIDESGCLPGATLLFAREDWAEAPFKPISVHEDMEFVNGQMDLGILPLPVYRPGMFVVVRHPDSSNDRGHSWMHVNGGRQLEHHLLRLPRYRTPESLLPRWALPAYTAIQRDLLAGHTATAQPRWTLFF